MQDPEPAIPREVVAGLLGGPGAVGVDGDAVPLGMGMQGGSKRDLGGGHVADLVQRPAGPRYELQCLEEVAEGLVRVPDHDVGGHRDTRTVGGLDETDGLVDVEVLPHGIEHTLRSALQPERQTGTAGAVELVEERRIHLRVDGGLAAPVHTEVAFDEQVGHPPQAAQVSVDERVGEHEVEVLAVLRSSFSKRMVLHLVGHLIGDTFGTLRAEASPVHGLVAEGAVEHAATRRHDRNQIRVLVSLPVEVAEVRIRQGVDLRDERALRCPPGFAIDEHSGPLDVGEVAVAVLDAMHDVEQRTLALPVDHDVRDAGPKGEIAGLIAGNVRPSEDDQHVGTALRDLACQQEARRQTGDVHREPDDVGRPGQDLVGPLPHGKGAVVVHRAIEEADLGHATPGRVDMEAPLIVRLGTPGVDAAVRPAGIGTSRPLFRVEELDVEVEALCLDVVLYQVRLERRCAQRR